MTKGEYDMAAIWKHNSQIRQLLADNFKIFNPDTKEYFKRTDVEKVELIRREAHSIINACDDYIARNALKLQRQRDGGDLL